jgi:5-methylcytosine-specific restriction endonuclease McrA
LPVSVISVRKAIILLFLEKAEVIKNHNTIKLYSPSISFSIPLIIRLHNFYQAPKSIDLTRKNIFKRDGMKCQYCGKRNTHLTIDHILPKSRGGKDDWENLITSCDACNNSKGNRLPEEAGMKLLSKPRRPNPINFIKFHYPQYIDDWKDYLFY